MRRMFRYIIVTDAGDAPCSDGGLLTLATCKPAIRRSAKPGDWVVAIRSKARNVAPEDRGRLVWAGRVERSVGWDDYSRQHPGRLDAVYSPDGRGGFVSSRPEYHPSPDARARDLGGPVLVFEPCETWYFGVEAEALPDDLSDLSTSGQGHRIGHALDRIDAFATWIRQWPSGIRGKHIHADPGCCGLCPSMRCT